MTSPHKLLDDLRSIREFFVGQNRNKAACQIDEAIEFVEARQWHPIETAPKDKILLLWAATDVADDGTIRNWKMGTGCWNEGHKDYQECTGWIWENYALKTYETHPTHWMPLPPSPPGEE